MPSRGTIVVYEGPRGTVYRIKYRDADRVQVMETIGRDRREAERELRNRLTDVDRDGYRKPGRVSFRDFAERFKREYLPGRNLKPSTLLDYEGTIDRHLVPFFDETKLAAIEAANVDAYIAAKTGRLSAKTIGNQLGTLGIMFKVARRWRLVSTNPVAEVERPRVDVQEMQVLTEGEIARVLVAYRELEREAEDEERPW